VSALIVNDAKMQELNRLYRAINSPTDVLSFRMADGEFSYLHPDVLGDIVISADTARRRPKPQATVSPRNCGCWQFTGHYTCWDMRMKPSPATPA